MAELVNPFALRLQVEAVEQLAVRKALRASTSRRHAARLLEISLRALYYKIEQYGLGQP